MNDSTVLLIAGFFVLAAAVTAIVLQWFRAFYTVPVQATIRALVGLMALLVGTLGVPSIEGNVVVSLDSGAILNVEQSNLQITTAAPTLVSCLAWGSVTVLLALSLNLIPKVIPHSAPESVV